MYDLLTKGIVHNKVCKSKRKNANARIHKICCFTACMGYTRDTSIYMRVRVVEPACKVQVCVTLPWLVPYLKKA